MDTFRSTETGNLDMVSRFRGAVPGERLIPTSCKSMPLNKSVVEDAALTWFAKLGYAVRRGPHLAPGEPAAERDSFQLLGVAYTFELR